MGESCLASIIISSYNYGRFLPEAIDSALNQTYPSTEVIVVDDGSTDNSQEIIASYGERVTPVLKANGGQASAFNAGFEVSRGEVICFLDSDDALLPTAVERAVNLFTDEAVSKVHWPLWAIDQKGRKTGRVIPAHVLSEGDLQEVVICGGPGSYTWPPTTGNAWSRGFIESIFPMPEVEYVTCPDLYLSTFAPFFGPVKRILEPQGFWRIHGRNNSWQQAFDERLTTLLRRWDHCFDVLNKYCRRMGIDVNPELWKAKTWYYQIHQSIQEIAVLLPLRETFILVDQNQWETDEVVAGRRCIPFLERDGQYWGPPTDDAAAIGELERLRQAGAGFIAFAWPAFWWLDYYVQFHNYLYSKFHSVMENSRLKVFDLRE